jgi:uncharacterized membrane protein
MTAKIRSRRLSLSLRVERSDEGVLLAPVQGAMDRRIGESNDARAGGRCGMSGEERTERTAPDEGGEKETGRVEAFSDGVFAIAITLLVLELKVPRGGDGETLAAALLSEWPSYVAFLTSFATIGIMWINHHRLFTLIRRVDHIMLVLNLLLLLGVTIVPFPTSLVAEHLGHAGGRLAALIYAGNGLIIALGFWGLWRYTSSPRRTPRLLRFLPDSPEARAINAQYRFGPLFYLAAFGLAFLSPWASIAFCAALAMFFALPPRMPSAGKELKK